MAKLFRMRLETILKQLSSDQVEEVFEWLLTNPKFAPEGYPTNYTGKTFDELSWEEVKYLHDTFIQLQYSEEPELQGEDIRGVIVTPYKPNFEES